MMAVYSISTNDPQQKDMLEIEGHANMVKWISIYLAHGLIVTVRKISGKHRRN